MWLKFIATFYWIFLGQFHFHSILSSLFLSVLCLTSSVNFLVSSLPLMGITAPMIYPSATQWKTSAMVPWGLLLSVRANGNCSFGGSSFFCTKQKDHLLTFKMLLCASDDALLVTYAMALDIICISNQVSHNKCLYLKV